MLKAPKHMVIVAEQDVGFALANELGRASYLCDCLPGMAEALELYRTTPGAESFPLMVQDTLIGDGSELRRLRSQGLIHSDTPVYIAAESPASAAALPEGATRLIGLNDGTGVVAQITPGQYRAPANGDRTPAG